MPKRTARRVSVSSSNRATLANETKPVALTVKVDGQTYVRLSTLRAMRRTTNQEILKKALSEFLDRSGA
jgi:hypothetical protein